MAYSGTTAASSVQNPPILLIRALSQVTNATGNVVGTTTVNAANNVGGGCGIWYYQSTDYTSNIVNVVTNPYFTDGYQLGMRNGDVIFIAGASSANSTTVFISMAVLCTTNSTGGFSVGGQGAKFAT